MVATRAARKANPPPSWHPEDRPAYAELVAAVCDCGKKLAAKIVDAYPHGYGIAQAKPSEFRSLGLTAKQALRLAAAFELGRFVTDAIYERQGGPISSPADVRNYLYAHMSHLGQESFVVIILDARMRVIDATEVALGSLTGIDIHPREVFRHAVQLGAHALILAHNHPSGDAIPSDSDVEMTRRAVEVGQLLGIPIVDSVVVGRLRGKPHVTSMTAMGMMPKAA